MFNWNQIDQKVKDINNIVWNHTTNVIKDVLEIEISIYDVGLGDNFDENLKQLMTQLAQLTNKFIFISALIDGEEEGSVTEGRDVNFQLMNFLILLKM